MDTKKMELEEKLIYINRVSKVVKGGRNFSFAAQMVVGDKNGSVGIGKGRAKEVPSAIKKGIKKARKELKRIPLVNGTIPHEVIGVKSGARVFMKPASPGTGVIAGSAMRAVLEAAGVENILTKSIGSNNPENVAKATMNALLSLESKEDVEKKRGVKVTDYQIDFGGGSNEVKQSS